MKDDHPSLAILLPTWNQQVRIEAAVASALDAAQRLVDSRRVAAVEVVVVDDSSTDATGAIIDQLAEDEPRLVVLHHPSPMGLGAALRSGFRAIRSDLVYCTAPGQRVDAAVLDVALRLLVLAPADVVLAYHRSAWGTRRRIAPLVYRAVIRVLYGLTIHDTRFPASLYRHEVIDELVLESQSSFIDVELIARAERRGRRVVQFPTSAHGPERRPSPPSATREKLAEMISLRPQILSERPRPPRHANG